MAASTLAVVVQAAPPTPVFANHGSAPAGRYWVPGTGGSYIEYTHYNEWRCAGTTVNRPGVGRVNVGCTAHTLSNGGGTLPGADAETTDGPRTCTVNSPALTDGCGHTAGGGWVHNGHPKENEGVEGSYTCTAGGSTITGATDAAHCGDWVDCYGELTGPSDRPTGCTPCVSPQVPNTARTDCVDPPPEECADGQHRHGSEACGPDHQPGCAPGVARPGTGAWPGPGHTGEAGDGHAAVEGRPGCDPPTTTVCVSGQHRHAGPGGGHAGCRSAHSAPSCSWSGTTWSPGHGGAASDGHATTTGLRRCTTARGWCADFGADAFTETIELHSGQYSPDGRWPARPVAIPYGRNLGRSFTPYLSYIDPVNADNSRVRPVRIDLAPGRWATLTWNIEAPNRTRSLAVEAYDYDTSRWRNCGSMTWTRTLSHALSGAAVETAAPDRAYLRNRGIKVRFRAGDCPSDTATLTITARWAVKFNARAGDSHDRTYNSDTTSRWRVRCNSVSPGVDGICDTLSGERKADIAFNALYHDPVVQLAGAGRRANTSAGAAVTNPVQWVRVPPSPTAPGGPSSAVLARLIYVPRDTSAQARATNPYSGTTHSCGPVGFRITSLAWTAGAAGDNGARAPAVATATGWAAGAPAKLPVRCAAAWPPGRPARYADLTPGEKETLRLSLANCTAETSGGSFGAFFLTPETSLTNRGKACSRGPINITLTLTYEAGMLVGFGFNWSSRYRPIRGWTGTRTVTVAAYTWPECGVTGI